MPCRGVSMPGGGSAIVCGTRLAARCACGRRATLLCDWKVPEHDTGTCDADLCAACSTSPAPGKDICPRHARALAAWQASRAPVGEPAR